MNDNVARIDYSKCINCGLCAEKCPRKIIETVGRQEKLREEKK
ncbi:MAG: 4Fe-4S binding protein [Clostridia bacterium]|nr:4Fe-4S binding protein [Clostridia bacterium]